MKKFIASVISLGLLASGSITWADATLINGAGSTMVYPAMTKWFAERQNQVPDVQFNYQSIGSGGGIKQFSAQTVDFGASDAPMSNDQMAAAAGNVLQLPDVIGAVVPIYNVAGVSSKLKFSQKAIVGIFMGTITRWNDPAIQSANPDLKLPPDAIVVVHRSDGSGTTYCWVDFLSKISYEWKGRIGKGTSVNWPVGLGGKGNEGVAGLVKDTPNSIGYVELIYAIQNKMTYGDLQNSSGKYVEATLQSATTAAASVKMPSDFRISITNPPAADAYPAATYSWVMIYKRPKDKAKGKQLVEFLRWMLGPGQKVSADLGYAPLPQSVIDMEIAALNKIAL
jgi:phosphate transport system substrate-binding protein